MRSKSARTISLGGCLRLLIGAAFFCHHAAFSEPISRFYTSRLDQLVTAHRSMIDALADASLNSACLSTANFNKVIAGLEGEARNTAVRMRESGIKKLNETRAWRTCKGQAEQATLLKMNMDTAQTWSLQRAQAKRHALLTDEEELEDGALVHRNTKAPVNSGPRLFAPVSTDALLEGTYGIRGTFDAALTVSQEGLVSACDVVSSIGNEGADQAICRKARLLMRYRPAFADGRLVPSTTHLRLSVID
ncbi:energy transducer TonB [Allosphingosinicella vermicomposti]|uniref:energy transducer TonB n=1 Tax=Allosphingosinicella vermicomposti TaxID=614671 RepID=UPI001A9C562D|nr:hypothetical protein [Allosphingosinicella vermicomposti]